MLLIIKPNNFEFKKDLYYNNKEKLYQDLQPYIEHRTIEINDMMEIIVNEIGLTPDLVGESETCYETAENVNQLCYVGKNKNESEQKDLNIIATYLNGDTVYGTAVLLNSKITENGTCVSGPITINDCANILYSKFVHKGIFIPFDENVSVTEYEYFAHPLEYLENSENGYLKYKLFETTFLSFNLGLFSEITSQQINKRATRLLGNAKLFGNVVMLNKLPHEFHDIDLSLFEKIYKLSYGPLNKRELLESENTEGNKINGLPVIMNRYRILEKRYKDYQKNKKLCDNCNKDILSNKLVCSGCYRMRYHNKDCQKSDWSKHVAECLYNK